MRVARLLIVTSALLSLVFAFPHEAWACSCEGGGPPCQSVFQVDAIFAGTVSGLAALPDDDLPPLRPGESRIPRQLRVDFVDVQGYRAVQGTSISVLTPGSGASCGYAFKQGQRYLVYAMRQANGTELVTSICSRTRLLVEADEDLRFLQTLGTSRSSRAFVYGTINHWERNLSSGQPRDDGPVANVFVSVAGLGGTFGVSTDDRGRYEVAVAPGKYEVQVLPPAAYSARYLRRSIEVSDVRACAMADFSVRFDGRIRGFVRQSTGEPSANVSVQVMAADDVGKSGNIQTLNVQSDADGSFEFSEVSPGRYVVGVDLRRGMDPKVVFPPTFHPGTPNPAAATVVELDGGQHRDLEPMTLPPARRSLRLTGTVVYEDGRPAAGAFISLRDGIETWRQVAVGTRTGSDGTFSFTVYEGLSYIASSSQWDEEKRKRIAGTLGPFVATQDTGPVRVVISPAR
jgi:hypothetical protein